jgi:ribosomal RNA assembly protein
VIVDIKEWAGRSRSRLATLRGRVIGTGGKTKRLIQRYTGARLAIYGKTVAIMGEWAAVELARQAVEMLLAGRAHSTVYRFLEVRG